MSEDTEASELDSLQQASPFVAGDIIAEKYRIDKVLGVGGMGVVVAVTHVDLLEPRAIKMMRADHLHNTEAVARFVREARASARLKGEHVAKVYDVGKLQNGAPFMVMEHLSGSDLGAVIEERGIVPLSEAARYVIEACEALAEAHIAGIVHRDLKPENIFLARGAGGIPTVKVLDFGISFVLNSDEDVRLTKTSTIMGSPFYMSPEQARSSRNVDARSDIWSLGVVLYQLVTGRLPFDGENLTEIISAVMFGRIVPPSEVVPGLPTGIDAVIAKCLARDLDERYRSVTDLAEDIASFAPMSVRGVVARTRRMLPSTRIADDTGAAGALAREGSASPPRRSRWRATTSLAAGAGLAFAVGAVALLIGSRKVNAPVSAAPNPPKPTMETAVPEPRVTPVAPVEPPSAAIATAASVSAAPTASMSTAAAHALGRPWPSSTAKTPKSPATASPTSTPPVADPFGAGRQ